MDLYENLLSTLNMVGSILNSKENEISNSFRNKFFGKKGSDVIGCIIFIEIIPKTVSWYNGLTFQIVIHYQPTYLFNIAKDAEEVFHIEFSDIQNYIFSDDLASLKLLLEVSD